MMAIPTGHPWIACPKPIPQAQVRLFCFPYAGGGASLFRPWADELPAPIEICAIKLPGREGRLTEPPCTSVSALVPVLADVLRPYLRQPFAFLGHSLGALVGFELARYLRRKLEPAPQHLFAAGHRAPHLPNPHPPLHHLPIPELLQKLRELGGTPREILEDAELIELLLPTLRADFSMAETYTYAPDEPLSCPITVFGGLADKEVNKPELAAWREQTHHSFYLRMLPGDHFFLHTSRSLLLRYLAQDLLHQA